jgi:flagellar protein FliJ
MPFRFPLAALLTLREHRRDLVRQALGELLSQDQRLQQQIESARHERRQSVESIRQLTADQQFDPKAVSSHRLYMAWQDQQILLVEDQRTALSAKIERCRQLLVKADQDVKAIEQLEQSQHAAYLDALLKKEGRELEEVWQAGQLQKQGLLQQHVPSRPGANR